MKNFKKKNSRISLLISPPNKINDKFTSSSEIIVNIIMEKIISLTISTSTKNKIESETPGKCFTYIEGFLANKLQLEFLPHDSDDFESNKNPNELSVYSDKFIVLNTSKEKDEFNKSNYIINHSKNTNDNTSLFNIEQIYYNNNIFGENNWDIIDEPKSSKYDSYSCTMVKFIGIEKQEMPIAKIKSKHNKNNKKEMQVNELEEVKEEESLSKSNIYNKNDNIIEKDKDLENNDEKNIINKEDNKKNEMNKRTQNQVIKKINPISQNNQGRKKRNDIDINQFPYKDIEDDDSRYMENNDEINYDKLRKELIEKEEAKLKEEAMKAKKKNKTIDIKSIIGENNANRQYIGKNITVDPNGQIVLIKAIKLNKLKQEFKYPKTILKNVKQPKKIIKKENKEIIDTPKIEKNKESKENKENIIKKEEQIIENNKEKEIELNNLEEQINSVSKKILPRISQKRLNLHLKTENNEVKKRREPVFPSGSNFNLINMEIGVSIKEDEKFKTGGKDFFKKFNKYSKDIYNEKLKESLTANSFLNTKTQLFNEETNKFKTESNFEHTYGGFNMTLNQDKDTNQKYLMTSTNNFGNYNYTSNISNLINSNNNMMTKTVTNGITSNINHSNILNPSIRLSNISSLIGSLEKLNLITEREERYGKKYYNLFKHDKKNKLRALLLNNNYKEMDEFTKDIIKTGDISNRGGYKSQGKSTILHTKNPEKPSILEITRELGYKNKPYRNRSKINSSLVNPVLKTVAFFKQ